MQQVVRFLVHLADSAVRHRLSLQIQAARVAARARDAASLPLRALPPELRDIVVAPVNLVASAVGPAMAAGSEDTDPARSLSLVRDP